MQEMANDQRPTDKFRILCVDGGGIRGLIPALVLADIERRLQKSAGPEARVSDYFQMFAGTSTGGLVALSLTAPDPQHPGRPAVTRGGTGACSTATPSTLNGGLSAIIRCSKGFATL